MAKKSSKSLVMIEKIAKGLDVSKQKEQTLLEISSSEQENAKILTLKRGSWSGKEPWFVLDEKQKLHALIPIEALSKVMENLRQMEEEAFSMKLEKSILQQLPIDFQDVWTVAMEEVQKRKSKDIDFEKLVRKIKKEHPNLFLDLRDLYLPEGVNIMQQFE